MKIKTIQINLGMFENEQWLVLIWTINSFYSTIANYYGKRKIHFLDIMIIKIQIYLVAGSYTQYKKHQLDLMHFENNHLS